MPNNQRSGKRADPYYQAQDILSRRDHSEAEVRDKLKRKRFADSQIANVIAKLKEERLLDDARFAAVYIEDTLRFKAVGPRWLTYKLAQKRVAPAIVAETLSTIYSPDQEAAVIQQAVTSWQRQHRQFDALRLSRFLLSRGFSPHLVSRTVSDLRNLP